jgi:hypothetical protein
LGHHGYDRCRALCRIETESFQASQIL